MNQNIREKALNVIQQHKRDAIAAYEKANEEVFKDENYIKLEQKYNKIMIENARKEAFGELTNKKTEQAILKQLEEMRTQKEPKFFCEKCKDEGRINGADCSCLKTAISQILLNGSGFEKLENFDDAIKTSGNLKNVYELMRKWCNSEFKKTVVYLAGPTGVGKTYLLRAMANELINRGKIIKLTSALNMNMDFRDFNKTAEQEIFKKYITCEILFIDDLGTEPIYKNITIENLYNVINERKMRQLPTVITSNLTLDDLKQRYEERIFSRIADRETSITLYLDGEDKRLQKK